MFLRERGIDLTPDQMWDRNVQSVFEYDFEIPFEDVQFRRSHLEPVLHVEPRTTVSKGLHKSMVTKATAILQTTIAFAEFYYSPLNTVSTEEILEPKISIHPNPASNHTRIQLSEGQLSQVCIYDLSGQQVHCQEDGELDLQSLKAGVYLVEVRTKNGGKICLLYTSPSPRDRQKSRMPSSA